MDQAGDKTNNLMKKTVLVFMALILVLGCGLRFYNLKDKGFIQWDEAAYMMEAKFYKSVFENIKPIYNNLKKGLNIRTFVLEEIEGWSPVTVGKPFHTLLIYLISFFIGFEDYTGSVLSALLGLATVFVVYIIGKRLYGPVCGLVSAAACSVSGLHLMYSRSPLAEISVSFLFISGLYLFYCYIDDDKPKNRLLVYSGLLFGCAMASNYRFIFIVGMVLFFALIYLLIKNRQDAPSIIKIYAILTGASIIPPLVFELPFLVLRIIGKFPGGIQSYWESVYLLYIAKTVQGNLAPHTLFLKGLWTLEGPFVVFLLVCGLIVLLKNRLRFILFGLPIVLPIFIFSMLTRGDRFVAISISIPFIALAAGVGAAWLADKIKPNMKTATVIVGVLVILFYGAYNSRWVLPLQSGWKEAVEFINYEKHFSLQTSISKFYVGRKNCLVPPANVEDFVKLIKESNYKYLIIDWKKYYKKHNESATTGSIHCIENSLKPVKVIQNSVVDPIIYIDEMHSHTHVESLGFDWISSKKNVDKILIYDLTGIRDNPDLLNCKN